MKTTSSEGKIMPDFYKNHTLVELIETLVELDNAPDEDLDKDSKKYVNSIISELSSRLKLSSDETVVFSRIFHACAWEGFTNKKVLNTKENKTLNRAATINKAINNLEMAGLISIHYYHDNNNSFTIPDEVLQSVFQNKTPETTAGNLDNYVFCDKFLKLIEKINSGEYSTNRVSEILCAMMRLNPGFRFFKFINKWGLNDDEVMVMSFLFMETLTDDKDVNTDMMVFKLFGTTGHATKIKRMILNESGKLFSGGIICHADEEFKSGKRIRLTDSAIREIFGADADHILDEKIKFPFIPIIAFHTIPEKQLFFNDSESAEIEQLKHSLEETNFNRIAEEMKAGNIAEGFTVLLYGGPGTGKTETVMQLARLTGRDILKVDISALRDKYIGESEKQTKQLFSHYKKRLDSAAIAPILLLNEADGIISHRLEKIKQASDQMHNTMQNIFLEEMETFKGILIATTNLQNNLDPAFERRFLFKIGLTQPSPEVLLKLVLMRFKNLDMTTAEALTRRFRLSGGQLDNICRKAIAIRLLTGKEPDSTQLNALFEKETLFKEDRIRIAGFGQVS